MICGSEVGPLKRRVPSHPARWEMKNCTPLCREANFQVKMYTAHHARRTFGSWDVEKVHAVVARSTFPSQKCKKLTGAEHFWTFRCRLRVAGARDCAPCQKWANHSKPEGFLWFSKISKNDGERGTFEEDLERWIFRGRRSIMSQTC